MKSFVFFLIVFTLAEIIFSYCYYTLAGEINSILIIGAIIYVFAVVVAYVGIRSIIYKEKRNALIDSLPG